MSASKFDVAKVREALDVVVAHEDVPDSLTTLLSSACDRIERLERVAEAARNTLFPSHGEYGGPLVQVKAFYEDGSEYDPYQYARKDFAQGHEKQERLRTVIFALDADDAEVK